MAICTSLAVEARLSRQSFSAFITKLTLQHCTKVQQNPTIFRYS